MPSERTLEEWLERGLDAIGELTKQVSRLAYATEVSVISTFPKGTSAEMLLDPCENCRSHLVPTGHAICPSCGAPLKGQNHA